MEDGKDDVYVQMPVYVIFICIRSHNCVSSTPNSPPLRIFVDIQHKSPPLQIIQMNLSNRACRWALSLLVVCFNLFAFLTSCMFFFLVLE